MLMTSTKPLLHVFLGRQVFSTGFSYHITHMMSLKDIINPLDGLTFFDQLTLCPFIFVWCTIKSGITKVIFRVSSIPHIVLYSVITLPLLGEFVFRRLQCGCGKQVTNCITHCIGLEDQVEGHQVELVR